MNATFEPTVVQTAPVRPGNAYASAALAFGLVGAVVLSVICAIAALSQIQGWEEGRGEALAGLGISVAWIVTVVSLAHAHVI
ncbi:hypothetical protein MKUB_34770 [Mycobacterium kubicae]|uniref:DUF4190 domain-containing protein n=2 Tax=Mycobacterium kubicae TaxID=120959 RepID=A0AAX1JJY6_9MYCO|nr:hypothetical protein [Mycobacterium kubicae]MCV7098268.1 hypothetical protein [Mycobacterium kubicae]OBK55738.1 hypothetical protein A5657_10700 [Mycobacterium kubicae]ORV98199.1 hypothetical protein AWC13_14495 [Mycobacterium kubicae]QNI15104.1 hypothetical protein GAN18_26795 [Mycobacterium kubicae]QPI41005.1 hypothetical protein I2456_26240 [Mycobacterium kubicae]